MKLMEKEKIVEKVKGNGKDCWQRQAWKSLVAKEKITKVENVRMTIENYCKWCYHQCQRGRFLEICCH